MSDAASSPEATWSLVVAKAKKRESLRQRRSGCQAADTLSSLSCEQDFYRQRGSSVTLMEGMDAQVRQPLIRTPRIRRCAWRRRGWRRGRARPS
jgi:hypothetical protein